MKKILAALAAMAGLLPGLVVAAPYDKPYGLKFMQGQPAKK
jgi:hypothetical protein